MAFWNKDLVTGQADIIRNLRQFRSKDAARILTGALLAGSRVIRDRARASLQKPYRKSKTVIGVSTTRKKKAGNPNGVKIGFAAGVSKAKQGADAVRAKSRSKTGGVGISSKNIQLSLIHI